MTSRATEEPMVLPSGNVVYGNWQDFPGQPPRFNVTREEGLSQDFLNSLDENPALTRNVGDGIGFLRKYLRGFENYQQEGTDIPERNIRTDFAQEQGGPLVERTLISGSPSFDLSVPDVPALGPETPAAMRRQQLQMLLPGHESRRQRAMEKYQRIFPFRGA